MAAKTINIALFGVGGVGKCFLNQLIPYADRLSKANPATKLQLVFVASSSKQLYKDDLSPLSLSSAVNDLASSSQPVLELPKVQQKLSSSTAPVILVDNTSNEKLAESYPSFIEAGISVITPNKKGFSSSQELWDKIFEAGPNRGKVYHESTVGAGLPVISTLNDLILTGDKVVKIEGVFSGTMSFLFNTFSPLAPAATSRPWSTEVSAAKAAGYTEPDPRDDLNGMDVARKLTILGRLSGLKIDGPSSFPVQSLIPEALVSATSGDEFLSRLPEFDAEMDTLKGSAAAEGKVLRYVGSIDVASKALKVGVEKFDKSHPIAGLKGSDNLISFYTERYGANPLVIQGAGAGGDVTAMGVLADLARVVREL